jgi:hypothetical protein
MMRQEALLLRSVRQTVAGLLYFPYAKLFGAAHQNVMMQEAIFKKRNTAMRLTKLLRYLADEHALNFRFSITQYIFI